MTWIPPEKRDTRYNIWYKRYMCRLNFLESRTMEQLQEYGMPTVFDPECDQIINNQMVIRMLTINDMVEYYKRNVNIYVVKYNDTKLIYEDIMAHLRAWKQYMDTSLMSQGDAPIEDLIILDKFANIVYKHAGYLFTNDYLETDIVKQLRGLMPVRVCNSEEAAETKEHPPHSFLFGGNAASNTVAAFLNKPLGLTRWG